jgi:hypothetical protein
MTAEWKEAKPPYNPGPIWVYQRGYSVNDAGRHENQEQFKAFQFYLNSGHHRDLSQTAEYMGLNPATIYNYAKKYGWDKRCAAYDKKEMALAFRQSNKLERKRQRRAIDDFRQANEDQARQMMDVSNDLVSMIQKRVEKANQEGEDIPLHLVSGLLRAAANMSDSGRQAWATSLGVGQLMEVVDTELEEVQVDVISEDVDDAYIIPLDE